MTKLLTTGEMIDRLKIGQKAIGKFVNNDILHDVEVNVFRCEGGHIKESTSNTTISLTKGIVEEIKWSIPPNYVSFEEAMQALKEGKRVKIHLDDGGKMTISSLYVTLPQLSLNDFVVSKWTIEED